MLRIATSTFVNVLSTSSSLQSNTKIMPSAFSGVISFSMTFLKKSAIETMHSEDNAPPEIRAISVK